MPPASAKAAAAVDNGAAEEVSAEDPGGGVYAEVEQQQQPPRDDASVDSGVIRCGVNLVDATAAVVAAATELLINEEPVPAGIAGRRLVPCHCGWQGGHRERFAGIASHRACVVA